MEIRNIQNIFQYEITIQFDSSNRMNKCEVFIRGGKQFYEEHVPGK